MFCPQAPLGNKPEGLCLGMCPARGFPPTPRQPSLLQPESTVNITPKQKATSKIFTFFISWIEYGAKLKVFFHISKLKVLS